MQTSPKFSSGGPAGKSFVDRRAWTSSALLKKQTHRRRLWIIDWEREVSHSQSFLFALWEPCSDLPSVVYPTMIVLLRPVRTWSANGNPNWDTQELKERKCRGRCWREIFILDGRRKNRNLASLHFLSLSLFLLDESEWRVHDILDSHPLLRFNLDNQIIFKPHHSADLSQPSRCEADTFLP